MFAAIHFWYAALPYTEYKTPVLLIIRNTRGNLPTIRILKLFLFLVTAGGNQIFKYFLHISSSLGLTKEYPHFFSQIFFLVNLIHLQRAIKLSIFITAISADEDRRFSNIISHFLSYL